ncbi:bactofilin family protein [Microbulbifer taiwanensis]|uniref:Polymer-forming cytoskeletal protein n=1 Tax=Microbulbifer taiwanensis TaxID=986746 RepID=A0ABW1YH13_9GAMM|nr:polymer-forming cytoskeletal protein [Microbulbifer taiwanensis]
MLGSKSDTIKSEVNPKPSLAGNGSAAGHFDVLAAQEVSAPAAIIGPKIRFRGELVGEEDLLIQGQIDGTIDLKDNNLTVGEQGKVKANVLAKTITVQGEVEGDIFAQERIAILSSSNVQGNLVAERVILEDGARFRGSIDMDVEAHRDQLQKVGEKTGASWSVKPGTRGAGTEKQPETVLEE